MRKILLAGAFALFGNFAMANELKSELSINSKYQIEIESNPNCCTSRVYYMGFLVQEYTECLLTHEQNCTLAEAYAKAYVRHGGGEPDTIKRYF